MSSVTEEVHEEVKLASPGSPMFARTRKIAEIAARRRVGLEKSLSRSSLDPGDEFPAKSNSVTDMRGHQQAAAGQKVEADKGLSAKASRSLSDLSMIDKRGGDVSSEDSAPVDKRKGVVRSKVKKAPQRTARRLRSASLDEGKVLRGESFFMPENISQGQTADPEPVTLILSVGVNRFPNRFIFRTGLREPLECPQLKYPMKVEQ